MKKIVKITVTEEDIATGERMDPLHGPGLVAIRRHMCPSKDVDGSLNPTVVCESHGTVYGFYGPCPTGGGHRNYWVLLWKATLPERDQRREVRWKEFSPWHLHSFDLEIEYED